MKHKLKFAVAGALTGALALTACSSSGASSDDQLSLVGYSVLEAANKPIISDFQETDAGDGVVFKESYGASGDQSRAVENDLDADVVHFSLETDVTRLVDVGLVDKDWKSGPTKGIATSSVVVFVVRKGNPKNIQTWDDLVKPGVEIITPNPGSSGSARWNILAGWAHATKGKEDDAAGKAYVTKFLNNVIALPGSGREATTAFTGGNGDVLMSYENEAILARQQGEDVDYVVPDDTLLIENPATVTSDAAPAAQDFLDYMLSKDAQLDYAKSGFRPVIDGVTTDVEGANDPSDPFPEPKTLYTIDDNFGGWDAAAAKFFDEESGIIPELQQKTGQTG
ncbi:sulfate ABC transporter substrate-binding protein [Solicola gregarius]|uniref:Sulfate ABC transporter substrate-binding protein n=1 Tax=Solicola gregarius TaxID=2908642 RepID=A0AA46TN81_9ACTN|nr:sulfate ABC transporter substrate-binding protein [Solicola gregarius]UYM07463.1 sulfate ABC transporter substrate-binding protein [Solicola gregarius]